MAFDPSIIMGYRGMGELPNPMNQLAQVSQIQAAQQQGQMNQMKIEEMLAERKEIDSTAAALKDKGYTPQTYFEMMVSSRNPERQKVGAEGLFRLKRQADFQSQFGPALGKMFGEPTAAPAETPAAGTFAADTAARRTAMAPAASVNAMAPASVNAMAPATAAARQPASINQMEQMAMQLGQYEDVPGAKTVANLLEKKLEAARKITSGAPGHVLYQNGVAISTVPETTNPEIKLYEYAKNQGYGGTLFDFKRDMAVAGRTPAQPRAEQPLEKVVDPATGKIVFASREDALRNKMTPAAAMEGLAPKEIQKREAVLPQATSAIKGFETKSNSFVNDLVKLRDHPGLSEITGFVAGRAPGITGAGRAAQALYDKVVAKGGFQALQDLRDASKTGGALGNVSDREGKQLIASAAAIDRRQNADDVKASIDQFIGDIQGASTRMREAYDSTYSYKTSAPAAAAGPNIDALLNKYK